ncbi:hypothetical protein HanLR1_Chr02g0039741 [Helianthus annuus]|nr:hypothetical protein HanLR1_Chr02g0039741 [Helianthus annuus]
MLRDQGSSGNSNCLVKHCVHPGLISLGCNLDSRNLNFEVFSLKRWKICIIINWN